MLLSEKNDTHLKGKRIDATEMPNIIARSCKMSCAREMSGVGRERSKETFIERTKMPRPWKEASTKTEGGGGVARGGRWREALSAKANRIQDVSTVSAGDEEPRERNKGPCEGKKAQGTLEMVKG